MAEGWARTFDELIVLLRPPKAHQAPICRSALSISSSRWQSSPPYWL